jgi:hypothetical protein|tara:strand:+ start:4155 stop:4805 length:651 start_codon:yes stop_codon:yes gene_type:complete
MTTGEQLAGAASNKFHPSFIPLLAGIDETGYLSPWAYVEYWIGGHGHMHLVGDGEGNDIQDGLDTVEGAADELASDVYHCGSQKHGKGQHHDVAHIELAYKAAIHQLFNTEYDRERAHQVWLQQMYQKWGGNMPAALLIPKAEDVANWQMMMPDHRGDPLFYDAGKHTIEAPTPQDMGAKFDASRGLWHVGRPWSPQRRMEALTRAERRRLERQRS